MVLCFSTLSEACLSFFLDSNFSSFFAACTEHLRQTGERPFTVLFQTESFANSGGGLFASAARWLNRSHPYAARWKGPRVLPWQPASWPLRRPSAPRCLRHNSDVYLAHVSNSIRQKCSRRAGVLRPLPEHSHEVSKELLQLANTSN